MLLWKNLLEHVLSSYYFVHQHRLWLLFYPLPFKKNSQVNKNNKWNKVNLIIYAWRNRCYKISLTLHIFTIFWALENIFHMISIRYFSQKLIVIVFLDTSNIASLHIHLFIHPNIGADYAIHFTQIAFTYRQSLQNDLNAIRR